MNKKIAFKIYFIQVVIVHLGRVFNFTQKTQLVRSNCYAVNMYIYLYSLFINI